MTGPFTSPLRSRWLLVLLLLPGCLWIFRDAEIESVQAAADSTVAVTSPVRAHLTNGRTAHFPEGVEVSSRMITGDGTLYDLNYSALGPVTRIPLDSVAAVETYRTEYDNPKTFGASLLATAGAAFLVPTLAVAIFGSCPTVYSDGADGLVLEAESFPNSIVPLFEQRDVDPLRVAARPDGTVELEVRNEALETHYINHLELIDVRHGEDEYALPAPEGRAFLLRGRSAPSRATDRAGRDVLPPLAAEDYRVFGTAAATLAGATPDDVMDHVDLVFPRPAADTVAVVLRLRNSLLNTVYFYDLMLAGQGARSLDWLGQDLASISYAVGLGDFYTQHMGLRVRVWDGSAYRESARVGEVGPIAWDDVAVPVRVPDTDSLRVRLHFVADAWRIDGVALADLVATVTPRRVPVAEAEAASPLAPPAIEPLVAAPDEDYLITSPGTRFVVRFETGPAPARGARTFFLAAQGYYTEWIRRDWLEPTADSTFVPSATTLHAAMQRWREVKPTFEEQFESSKIPVR
jgi:hypothetical protein